MKKAILIGLCFLLLAACDCIQHVSGTVCDRKTKLPLADVTIRVKASLLDATHTDSTGAFGYHGISGGLFGCPNVRFKFSKEGYLPCSRSFDSHARGEVVELVPLK